MLIIIIIIIIDDDIVMGRAQRLMRSDAEGLARAEWRLHAITGYQAVYII